MDHVVSARVYAWRDQPALPSTPPPGPVDLATWRLLWRVFAIRPTRVTMMAEHLGLTGGPPRDLAQLGRDHRLSRNRVAQVRQRLLTAAATVGPPEALRSLTETMTSFTVGYEDELLDNLIAAGLLAEPLTVESLTLLARLYGVKPPALETVAESGGRRIVAAPHIATAVRRWRSQLVVATMIVPVRLADVPPPEGTPHRIGVAVLSADHRLTCSDDGAVVWRSNLLCSAGDIVAQRLATGPKRVSALLEEITLRYANRFAAPSFRPPSGEALLAYLRAQPWAAVEGDLVSLAGTGPVPLRRTDRAFLDGVAGIDLHRDHR